MKTVDFSETIAAYDLNVGRCRQLFELMKHVTWKLIVVSECFNSYVYLVQKFRTSLTHCSATNKTNRHASGEISGSMT